MILRNPMNKALELFFDLGYDFHKDLVNLAVSGFLNLNKFDNGTVL